MNINLLFLLICFVLLLSTNLAQTKVEARKFTEFGNHSCEEYLANMDAFVSELSNVPNSKGYVMVYEGNSPHFGRDKNNKYVITKYILPQKGQAKSKIKTMKRRLRFRNIPNEKIVFVESGLRNEYTVEFWVVPAGAKPPKPTPTLKKIKYRKGKPIDFCGNDEV